MKETGIIMSGDHPKLILEGRKTQTRRTWGLEFLNLNPDAYKFLRMEGNLAVFEQIGFTMTEIKPTCSRSYPVKSTTQGGNVQFYIKCPYGQVGDRLWLKEGHKLTRIELRGEDWVKCEYRFEYENDGGIRYFRWLDIPPKQRDRLSKIRTWGKWRSPRFMYKFLARIWLEITGVNAERLQEITEADARAEGDPKQGLTASENDHRAWFQSKWDSLNVKRGYGWETNCWVWVLTFKRI